MTGSIEITRAHGVATLRLCNPIKRNAISLPMWHELAAFAGEIGAAKDIRVVVVRGHGDLAFSAGADISGFDETRTGENGPRAYDEFLDATCSAIEAIPQPTVALIKGACMGAGCSLAASCDLRVAAEGAFFAVPAARLGLGYDPRQIARLVRVFGAGAVRQMLFTADRLPAARAHALGAVHVLASDAEAAARDIVGRIGANAPLTLRAVKLAIRALAGDEAPGLAAQAERLYAGADRSADYAEGRRAFAEKRAPRFTGS